MISPVEHVIYKLRNAEILLYPYPHFYVEDVFPAGFYAQLLDALPPDEGYAPLAGGYANRQAAKGEIELVQEFNGAYFGQNVLKVFMKQFFDRFPNADRANFKQDLRFIRDQEGYKIGPHTDAPQKVVSLLFYLPRTDADADCGTGIYVPSDHLSICPGGPHHPFDGFEEVWRAPFLPNSCFGFWKTPNSWHAVSKICRKIERNVLLFNIYEDSSPGA